ncbi:hypothetical protein [Nostoc sp. FACHB-892]|uniref:hypothetical protein n=1 Tax=Nostoc sp. FACHB-892 TaxID=2692843 RepID=UPI001688761D|nr:hypothetical protein [Nostoc sp. FACHB-892]
MATTYRKTLPVRFEDDQYVILTHDHIQYMAETGNKVSLNTYIMIKLGLVEPSK